MRYTSAFWIAVVLATLSCLLIGVSFGSFVGSVNSATRDDMALFAGAGAAAGTLAVVTGIGSIIHAAAWGDSVSSGTHFKNVHFFPERTH